MSNAKLLQAILNNEIDINALRQYRHVFLRAKPGASTEDQLFGFSLRSAAPAMLAGWQTLIQAH
jgi:hypothetical protein